MRRSAACKETAGGRPLGRLWAAVRAVVRAAPFTAAALLLLAGAGRPAGAQVMFAPPATFNSGSLQAAWSHTVPAGGQDRYLLVGVSVRHTMRAAVVSEVRFVDGMNVTQQLTPLGAANFASQARVELWGVPNPNQGQGVITVRMDGTGGFVAGALSFTGVHQTSSASMMVSNTGTGETASLAVPSATGEAIVTVHAGNGFVVPVARAPHVRDWGFQGLLMGAGGHEPGRAGATVLWDTPGGSAPWLLAGISLRPAVATPPPPPDAGPDLPPDTMAPPPDTAPPPVDVSPPPVDTAPPPVDVSPPPVDTAPPPVDSGPLPVDTGSAPPDGPPGTSDTGAPADGGPGPVDGGAPTDGPPAGGGDGGAPAGDASAEGGVSVYNGAYSIGCACRLHGRPGDGSSGAPLWLLVTAGLVALGLRRRPRGR